MKITVEKINEIIAALDYVVPALPKPLPEGELSTQDAFLLMAPKLNQQIEKGATVKELAEFLQALEFPVKGAALGRFLDGYLAVQQKVQNARRAKASPVRRSRKSDQLASSASAKKEVTADE